MIEWVYSNPLLYIIIALVVVIIGVILVDMFGEWLEMRHNDRIHNEWKSLHETDLKPPRDYSDPN